MTFSANPISSAPISSDRLAYAATGITGTIATTNANDTLAASGTVTNPPITGTIATTNANDTLAASGTVTAPAITGTLATTNANDTLAASGTVTNPPITGTIAASNANDTLSASGTVTAPPSPPAVAGGFGGGSFVPDEGEQRKGYRDRRAELRRAITRAIEGPETVKAEALEILAPYMPPTKVERVRSADYVVSRLNWAQMDANILRIYAMLTAVAEEQEEEEAFLLML